MLQKQILMSAMVIGLVASSASATDGGVSESGEPECGYFRGDIDDTWESITAANNSTAITEDVILASINVTDVVLAVNMIFEEEPLNCSADLNCDNSINVVDIVRLVKVIVDEDVDGAICDGNAFTDTTIRSVTLENYNLVVEYDKAFGGDGYLEIASETTTTERPLTETGFFLTSSFSCMRWVRADPCLPFDFDINTASFRICNDDDICSAPFTGGVCAGSNKGAKCKYSTGWVNGTWNQPIVTDTETNWWWQPCAGGMESPTGEVNGNMASPSADDLGTWSWPHNDPDNDGEPGATGPGEGCSVVTGPEGTEQVPPLFSGSEAKAYCEDLQWAGYDDWRLPNQTHYRGIFHPTGLTMIEEHIFLNTYLAEFFGSQGYLFLSEVDSFYSVVDFTTAYWVEDEANPDAVPDLYIDYSWPFDSLDSPNGFMNASSSNPPPPISVRCVRRLGLCEGDFTVETADDIEAARSCTVVTGDLIIQNTDIELFFDVPNASYNFHNLSEVYGDLIIRQNANLEHIGGLTALKKVGGNFEISNNASTNFTALRGPAKLLQVGGSLIIKDNDHLENINYFQNFVEIGGNLEIENNPTLRQLETGFDTLTIVGGSIQITSNPDLCQEDTVEFFQGLGFETDGIANNEVCD